MELVIGAILVLPLIGSIAVWVWFLLQMRKRQVSKSLLLFVLLKAAFPAFLVLGIAVLALGVMLQNRPAAAVGGALLVSSLVPMLGHIVVFWWVRRELRGVAKQGSRPRDSAKRHKP